MTSRQPDETLPAGVRPIVCALDSAFPLDAVLLFTRFSVAFRCYRCHHDWSLSRNSVAHGKNPNNCRSAFARRSCCRSRSSSWICGQHEMRHVFLSDLTQNGSRFVHVYRLDSDSRVLGLKPKRPPTWLQRETGKLYIFHDQLRSSKQMLVTLQASL